MKPIYDAKWQSGEKLSLSPSLEEDTTAILAIKDMHKGNYFILPEIFFFDQSLNNFKGDALGKVKHWDYWYLLEDDLLKPLRNSD